MLGGAFRDDDLPHFAVVQHTVDVVVAGHQRLGAQVQLGVNLYRLWGGFFLFQDAKVGVKTQTIEGKNLCAAGIEHGVSLKRFRWLTPGPVA